MAHYREGSNMGFISTNDLSAASNTNKLVKLTSGQIVLAAAATDKIIGALLDLPTAGATGTVRLRSAAGTMNVQLGGTVAAGDNLTANASGLAITTVTGGDQIVGIALEAGTVGQVIEILPFMDRV